MIKLLIAEDQALLLSALSSLLDLENDIQVVHKAADGKSALDYILSLQKDGVDLVLTDIEMPHLCGIESWPKQFKNSAHKLKSLYSPPFQEPVICVELWMLVLKVIYSKIHPQVNY